MTTRKMIKIGAALFVIWFFGQWYVNYNNAEKAAKGLSLGAMTGAELSGKKTTAEEREKVRQKTMDHFSNGTVDTEKRRREMFGSQSK